MNTVRMIQLGMAASAVSFVVGCGGGAQYTIVSRAQPAAFARPSGCHAIVEPIRADNLVVAGKSEAQFLAEKKGNQVWAFERDKRQSQEKFITQLEKHHARILASRPGDDTFVIRPTWTAWEPGNFAGMFSKPGVATFVVDVLSPTGQQLDRIAIETRTTSYTAADRMKGDFIDAGKSMSRYIDENWTCAAR